MTDKNNSSDGTEGSTTVTHKRGKKEARIKVKKVKSHQAVSASATMLDIKVTKGRSTPNLKSIASTK